MGHRELVFLRSFKGHPEDEEPPPGPVVQSITEALAARPIAAVIATPSALHLRHALPLAEAGCHLFLEKPVATDDQLDECVELARIVKRRDLVTMVGASFGFTRC